MNCALISYFAEDTSVSSQGFSLCVKLQAHTKMLLYGGFTSWFSGAELLNILQGKGSLYDVWTFRNCECNLERKSGPRSSIYKGAYKKPAGPVSVTMGHYLWCIYSLLSSCIVHLHAWHATGSTPVDICTHIFYSQIVFREEEKLPRGRKFGWRRQRKIIFNPSIAQLQKYLFRFG